MKFTKYRKILPYKDGKKFRVLPKNFAPNIRRYWKYLTNPLASVQEGGIGWTRGQDRSDSIVRLKKKTRYLSSVPMGGIQDPYNIRDHYYGRYADTGYGGRVSEERLMHGQKHDRQHSSTRDVSSGPTSFLLSTNEKCTDGEFRFSRAKLDQENVYSVRVEYLFRLLIRSGDSFVKRMQNVGWWW